MKQKPFIQCNFHVNIDKEEQNSFSEENNESFKGMSLTRKNTPVY